MVPFVLRWPRALRPGQRMDTLLNTPDIMPTLLGLMGVPIPDRVEGTDLSFVLTGAAGNEPTSAFIGNPCPFSGDAEGLPEWRGVRTKKYTYVRGLEGPMYLFDNQVDPYQLHNLVGEPAGSEVQPHLDLELEGWLGRLGDDFAPAQEYIERFNYEVDERGIVPYCDEVGRSDLEGSRSDGTRRLPLR